MTDRTRAAEMLLEAADYISEHGLNQDGNYIGPDDSACAIGALYRVIQRGRDLQALHAARRVLMGWVRDNCTRTVSVTEWSDHADSAEAVILGLKQASDQA